MASASLLIVTALAIITIPVVSLRFDLKSGNTKCISEDMKSNALSVGNYKIVNLNDGYPLSDAHKLNVKVSSPHGNTYHYAEYVDSGNFAFTGSETGYYSACFWVQDHKAEFVMTIDFDWKTGLDAKDWSNVVKKGQVEVMEIEIKKLYDTVISIHEEMFYLREREEEMHKLNRETNSKMGISSIFSLVVCMAVASLQFWHLKTYFERKKLL